MRIVQACKDILLLGKQGENNAVQIQFPVEEWIEELGTGTFQLVHQRSTDTSPHAVVVTHSDGKVLWSVANTEVAVVGYGKCELQFYQGTTLAKSRTWVTQTLASLSDVGTDVPEPWESWVEEVLAAADTAEEAAEDAEDAKDAAVTAKTSAETASSSATASAASAASAATTASAKAAEAASSATSAAASASTVSTAISTHNTSADAHSTLFASKVDTSDYNPEAKTSAMTQSVGKDSNGKLWTAPSGGGEAKAFVATYGTTTAAEIATAVTAGKAVFCKYTNGGATHQLSLVDDTSSKYGFALSTVGTNDDVTTVSGIVVVLNKGGNEWSAENGSGSIPTKTSDLTNDSGFLTEHQSLSAYRTSAAQDEVDATKILKSAQAEKTSAMTQSVGIDTDGKLWVAPSVYPLSIVVTTQPSKMQYKQYQSISLDGAVITLTYSNGSTEIIDNSSVTLNPTTATTIGSLPITLSLFKSGYTLTTQFTVTVVEYDLSDWSEVAQCIRDGAGAAKIPVGTQFTTTHSVYGSFVWDVVGHDIYKKPSDASAHTMTLLAHYFINGIQFDAPEAMYYAETALTAGSYTFANGSTNYYFTLVNTVPAGGQICINSTPNTFTVYASGSSATALETGSVSTTEISGATSLGTLGSGDLNHWDRIRYGSNNDKESAIRQFINSNAAAGSVWTQQTHFDRPPSWNSSLAGFMAGLPSDFLAVVGEVDVKCKTNRVYEAPDSTTTANSTYTVRDKFYLPSQMEIFGSEDTPADGSVLLPYYEDATSTDRIKYRVDSHSSAGIWWLRTPHPTYAHFVRHVNSSGVLTNTNASPSIGCAPACTIY